MAGPPLGERWVETYRHQPETFDRFSRAGDPDGEVARQLLLHAHLSGRDVLEIGCGGGTWTQRLAPTAARYVAIEPEASMLRLARKGTPAHIPILRARAEALPFPPAHFDRVVATWVFANLRPKARARSLDEVRRVLRPNGECWLLENHWDDAFQRLRASGGIKLDIEVQPLLEDHGFELVQTVESELVFESEAEAARVLGQILGPRIEAELERHPARCFEHRVVLLRASG